jgi:dihydropteroate synthase
MNSLTDYDDVVLDVRNEIMAQVASAEAAGVHRSRIAIDPGIGFAKTVDQNWPILKHLDVLEAEGLPILMGASRKRFLGELLARNGQPREMDDREAATTAISVLMAQRKTWCVRVHDARSSRDAVEVVQRMAETK